MPYQTIILIVALIVLIAVTLIFLGDAKNNIRLTRLFYDEKCLPTKRVGSLWIDEKNKKWGCKTAQRLFGYSEIIDYDIQADGISLKKKSEYLRMGGDAAEMTAKRNTTFERIVVVVFVTDELENCVNIPIGNSSQQIGSIDYERCMKLANSICDELEKMKNIKEI